MESFWQDVRHGVRVLTKTRGFTAVAIVTLALGIGANTAIFSVVNAVLLRPLPYADPDHLVRVAEQVRAARPGGGRGGGGPRGAFVTGDTFQAWRESTQTLDGAGRVCAAILHTDRARRSHPSARRGVSASMFSMLGVSPQKGRLFNSGEDKPGADQVALLSDSAWTRRFARSRRHRRQSHRARRQAIHHRRRAARRLLFSRSRHRDLVADDVDQRSPASWSASRSLRSAR